MIRGWQLNEVGCIRVSMRFNPNRGYHKENIHKWIDEAQTMADKRRRSCKFERLVIGSPRLGHGVGESETVENWANLNRRILLQRCMPQARLRAYPSGCTSREEAPVARSRTSPEQ